MHDWLIVGAGFAGAVLAERIASQRGETVLLIDRRDHVGGNAYDHVNADGLLVHRYGPHIFHTNSDHILSYLSAFTAWRPYEHRVLAAVAGKLLPMPINLDTINLLYGLNLTSPQLEAFFLGRAEPVTEIRTSEDVVVSKIGRELYELFFRDYTRKQWGLDPSQLDKSVTARVPVRCDRDNRYFTDKHQCMPRDGFTTLFRRMLAHPNIEVRCGMDYRELLRTGCNWRRLIYTGRIDDFFDRRFGILPYRSLAFEHATLDRPQLQPVAVVNYPQDEPYTRITEYKHLTGQRHRKTSITTEFPCASGDPYYPIPRPENRTLYRRYEELADTRKDVYFVGRLATYQYYNMDQIVGQALATFRRIQDGDGRAIDKALLAAE
jgi:UDP-galactopyranose mutase